MSRSPTSLGGWHARLLLALGLTLAFLVPLMAARVVENARVRSWERMGFAPEQTRQWWSGGFSRQAEAIRWRANGFGPEAAAAWRTMEFIPPGCQGVD